MGVVCRNGHVDAEGTHHQQGPQIMALRSWFDQGVVAFRERHFEYALEMFDKAIQHGGGALPMMYDSRAAVLEKLGRYGDALKDAKRVIDISPQSPQGYTRSAKLFFTINRHDAALKMIDMAISRINDPVRRTEASVFRADILASQAAERAHFSKTACHIGKLPVEIIWEIMAYAAYGSPSFVYALHNVCRHWRGAVSDMPALWRTVILGQYRPVKKLTMAIERTSKLPVPGVTDLRVTDYVPPSSILQALDDWSTTPAAKSNSMALSLSIRAPLSFKDLTRWINSMGIPPSLRSLTMQIGTWGELPLAEEEAFIALWKAFQRAGTAQGSPPRPQVTECPLESLTLSRVAMLAVHRVSFPRLLTLRLLSVRGQLETGILCSILRNCPCLEHFELEYSETIFRTHIQVPTCTLPGLRTLRLTGPFAVNPFDIIVAPRLEVLSLRQVPRAVCRSLLNAWSPGRHSASPPLVELRIVQCGFKPEVLSKVLECVPTLRTLQISGSGENINPLVQALAGLGPLAPRDPLVPGAPALPSATDASSSGGGRGRDGPAGENKILLCTRLEHVDFSSSPELKGVPIRDLVKSRLPPETETEAGAGEGVTSSEGAGALRMEGGGGGATMEGDTKRPESTHLLCAKHATASSSTVPIRSIIMDGCPKVEPELLPWLRTKVSVSCLFEIKASLKRRRGL